MYSILNNSSSQHSICTGDFGPGAHSDIDMYAAEELVATALLGAASAAKAARKPLQPQHCKLLALGPQQHHPASSGTASQPDQPNATVYCAKQRPSVFRVGYPEILPNALAQLTGLQQLMLDCEKDGCVQDSGQLVQAVLQLQQLLQ